MSIMNRYLLFLCVIGVVWAANEDELKAWFLGLSMECTKEHSLSGNEIMLLQSQQIPDTDNARCFLACVYKKAKWFDDKGLYNLASAEEMAKTADNAEKAELGLKVFKACTSVNDVAVKDGEKGCERAKHLFKCLTENANKVGFHIKNII